MGRSRAVGALGMIVRGVVSGASDRELLGLVGRGLAACLLPDDEPAPLPPLRVSVSGLKASKGKRAKALPASAGGGPPPARRRRPRTVVDGDGYVSGEVVSAAEVRAGRVKGK